MASVTANGKGGSSSTCSECREGHEGRVEEMAKENKENLKAKVIFGAQKPSEKKVRVGGRKHGLIDLL